LINTTLISKEDNVRVSGKAMDKPRFTRDQLIPSSVASKNFGKVRKQVQERTQFISDNGVVDTVVMGYDQFERMYRRLRELEEREEARILETRIDRLEKHPETAIPWRKVRRTGRTNE
jgi:hypothetical protein